MDATEFHSERELLDFLGQAQKMQDLTDRISCASCCYMVAFTDITGADPVSMITDISTDGSCQVRVTEL